MYEATDSEYPVLFHKIQRESAPAEKGSFQFSFPLWRAMYRLFLAGSLCFVKSLMPSAPKWTVFRLPSENRKTAIFFLPLSGLGLKTTDTPRGIAPITGEIEDRHNWSLPPAPEATFEGPVRVKYRRMADAEVEAVAPPNETVLEVLAYSNDAGLNDLLILVFDQIGLLFSPRETWSLRLVCRLWHRMARETCRKFDHRLRILRRPVCPMPVAMVKGGENGRCHVSWRYTEIDEAVSERPGKKHVYTKLTVDNEFWTGEAFLVGPDESQYEPKYHQLHLLAWGSSNRQLWCIIVDRGRALMRHVTDYKFDQTLLHIMPLPSARWSCVGNIGDNHWFFNLETGQKFRIEALSNGMDKISQFQEEGDAVRFTIGKESLSVHYEWTAQKGVEMKTKRYPWPWAMSPETIVGPTGGHLTIGPRQMVRTIFEPPVGPRSPPERAMQFHLDGVDVRYETLADILGLDGQEIRKWWNLCGATQLAKNHALIHTSCDRPGGEAAQIGHISFVIDLRDGALVSHSHLWYDRSKSAGEIRWTPPEQKEPIVRKL